MSYDRDSNLFMLIGAMRREKAKADERRPRAERV